jgi:hypothetical protein
MFAVLSIPEVLEMADGSPVAVLGVLYEDSDGTRLCEALAESSPPQCGGAVLPVANPVHPDLAAVLADAGGDVRTSDGTVELYGFLEGGELWVDPSAAHGDMVINPSG